MTDGEELPNVLEATVVVFETPEDSNNGMETALTKCPMKLISTYDKILNGGPRLQSTQGLRQCADGAPVLMREWNGC